MLMQDFLEYYTRICPDNLCVSQGEASFTYVQLDSGANQLANGLIDLGVEKGQRVAILGENSPEHYRLFMATAKMGAVATPLNYRLSPAELAFIIADAEIQALVVLPGLEVTMQVLSSQLPANIKIFNQGEGVGSDYAEWLCNYPTTKPAAQIDAQDAFLQLYTSGTTGNPKGVVISHANILALCAMNNAASSVAVNRGATGIICAPLFHIGGVGSVAGGIYSGLHCILHQAFVPAKVVADMENHPVASIFMVPAMIGAILQMPDIEKRDFSKLQQMVYGASAISETLLRRALEVFQCDFIQMYGMTETTGTVINLSGDDHRKALAGNPELLRSAGRPSLGVQVKTMTSQGQEVAVGEVGELWIKSDTNMLGYHHLAEATAETLTDGWVRTGDAGYIDEQGYIYLKDRIKDMVVSGAENIYPVEVENAIAKHRAIVDVAVIGVPDEKFGEALLAFVVLKPEINLECDELIEFCRDKIAGYKIPRQLQVVTELPRNSTGKVLKKTLREPFWKDHGRAIG